jgi:ribosomal protein L2
MEIKIGDKVYIEAEVVNIDKFSQHKYIVKLTSGEQRSISEKDVCGIVNDNEQDKKG